MPYQWTVESMGFTYFVLLAFILLYGSGLGVTAGAHRLWSHRAYKAKAPLRLFLLWLHTLAGQVIKNLREL